MPLPPAITAKSSWALATPLAASIPSAPQASSSTAVGTLPSRRSTPVAKIARPSADDEQVADVDVGEGGGEQAPPLVLERDHQAAEGGERVAAGLLDQQQGDGAEDDGEGRVGPEGPAQPVRGLAATQPRPPASARALRLEPAVATLQLRRPLT